MVKTALACRVVKTRCAAMMAAVALVRQGVSLESSARTVSAHFARARVRNAAMTGVATLAARAPKMKSATSKASASATILNHVSA